MKKLVLALLTLTASAVAAQGPSAADLDRWKREAQNVTISRDDWGIAHVHGKTDADAVFGMIYAQAEDDFNRVETNFINSQGRLAEAEGEGEIWRDLRMKLFIDPDSMRAKYVASPDWLRKLMNSWADGLNYYLYTHPQVKPRVISRFEPWMALTFSEGSIGGDIEKVNLTQLAAFYGKAEPKATGGTPGTKFEQLDKEPRGSNGAAIAPANEVNHRALLLINPHTSFFFRSEIKVESDEGLDAYGAATWGQFFIYQGFNNHNGWMHTSSGVDATDEYLETIIQKGDQYFYKYGSEERPLIKQYITVPFKTANGSGSKVFAVYRTHHGPIVRDQNGKWVAYRIMQKPMEALEQSYLRTKTHNYAEYKAMMDMHANSSNNTIYADADGNIAYFHANYIPKRDPKFDWTRPVDGSDPATEWGPLMTVDETPHLLNPASGWLYNSNNWPWSAAGPSSPKREDYPVYVDMGREESPRGYHALRVFSARKDFDVQRLIDAAFDSYQPWFAQRVPVLVKAYDALPASSPMRTKLAEQIDVLRKWDYRWGEMSIANSLANYWGDDVTRRAAQAVGGRGRRGGGQSVDAYIENGASPDVLLESLAAASNKLTADFGTWKTPWGEINRFQRINDNINPTFDDAAPSIPVPFSSARWGSLASFGARQYPNTKKWYGTSGNSFVAVVEFGKDGVRARAVTAGGESGDPKSPHFNDEAKRYASGNLRTVYFYANQLKGHTEKVYHPGE